jgi:DNA polymerase-3 subunit epsilon
VTTTAAGRWVPPLLAAQTPAKAPQTPTAVQGTFDELGTPLSCVTFVVVDLETTGGSPADAAITEIGAVKVRGGEVLGEFQTLVNPGMAIPAFIAVLTGITDAMVATAPRLGPALAAFMEFARGCVLVAHNAGFDTGFLKAACQEHELPWPDPAVIDTVRLARNLVQRDEARDHRLATLARLFGSATTPNHRALQDARATVDVLHGLIARVGNLGVRSLEELLTYTSRVPAATRRKRHLAEALPHAPGVYVFRDEHDHVLYVGTSVDIRTRVRSYFTAAEQRTRMSEMVALATSVTPIVCETALEARVRELRLIAEHSPTYNRRSRFPDRAPWVKLTVEPFPRLSVVRRVRQDGATYIGPFGSTALADAAVAALHQAFALRQCSQRLARLPGEDAHACLLLDIGRCGGPCVGAQDVAGYAAVVTGVRTAMTSDATDVVRSALSKAESLAEQNRFEEAAISRDRLVAFLRGASRAQRLAPLARTAELVAARRGERGGWELVLVRHGRLAATTLSPPGADPRPFVSALQASGDVVEAPAPPQPAAHPEETEQVLRWLEQPGVRLVELDGEWACPVAGAAGARARLDPLESLRSSMPLRTGFDEPARWPPPATHRQPQVRVPHATLHAPPGAGASSHPH